MTQNDKKYWKEDYDLEKMNLVRFDLEKMYKLNQDDRFTKQVTLTAVSCKIEGKLLTFVENHWDITDKKVLSQFHNDGYSFFTIDNTAKLIYHSILHPETDEFYLNMLVSKEPKEIHDPLINKINEMKQEYESKKKLRG